MNPIWDHLGRVRTSTFRTEGELGERRGNGTITVLRPDPATIEWQESGHWQAHDERPIPYRDRLRWVWDAERAVLSLAHLRLGEGHQVQLVEFEAPFETRLVSTRPHLCGEDRYDAELCIHEGVAQLTWRVTGPSKDYLLTRRYR